MRKIVIWTAMLGLTIGAFVPAFGADAGVRQFAASLADNAIAILADTTLDKAQEQAQLQQLFRDSADLDWVARFVLGKYWRQASPQQQQQFLENYKRFIIHNFTDRLASYSGQNYQITGVRREGEPNEYLVTLVLNNKGEPDTFIDYRIRETNGEYLIFDIIVEGISLITTQRSEFGSVVARNGLDFLIEALDKKAQQRSQSDG